ncbi:MAG: RDD family protein [Flavobacteriales bacterium]
MAYLIDMLPIVLIVAGVFHAFFGFDRTLQAYLNNRGDIEARANLLRERNLIRDGSFLIWVLYCMVLEASSLQGTLGKAAMGLKVVDANGQRLSRSHSVRRNLSKTFSYVVLALGFIWIRFDKKRQGWHDKLNRTFVVYKSL